LRRAARERNRIAGNEKVGAVRHESYQPLLS
jgi:hypothetical protein